MIPANQVITSLAILLVNWDEGKSYIENFIPFISQCILAANVKMVSLPQLQRRMLEDYGLHVPQNSLKSILNKMSRKGYVRIQQNAYMPNHEAIEALNIEPTRQQVLRQHNALVEKLLDFASKKYREIMTIEAGEEILLSYIKLHDIEILESLVVGRPLSESESSPDKKKSYIINSFVKHTYENDPEGFKYLDIIVKGNVLSNALLFPDLGRLQRGFRQTSVYLDTRLLTRTLGYEGLAYQVPCKELMQLLFEVGADIRCFKDTRNEVYNILYACKMAIGSLDDSRIQSSALRYFSESGYKPTDLELEMATLDKKIERLGIRVVEKPPYIERKYQIDESKLDQVLDSEVKYWPGRDRARIHDVDCLSAIYRLRKGESPYAIEECGALFVTTNSGLCQTNVAFFLGENYVTNGSVPITITDHALTTILWLKNPMAAPDLPQKCIIAECYAAMEPGERLWRKYLDKIKQLRDCEYISTDQYYLLRYTQEARTELSEITMGDEETFVEGTPSEILEKVKQSIREKDLTELELERKKREEVERDLRLEQDKSREKQETLSLNITRKSRKIAFFMSRMLFGLLVILLVLGAFYSLLGSGLALLGFLLFGAAMFFIAMSLFNLFFGTMVKDLLHHFERRLANWIQRILNEWFLPLG